MVDSRLVVAIFLVMAVCFVTMANGRAIERNSFDNQNNAARRAFMERRRYEQGISKEDNADDMIAAQRRDFPSGHYKGPCYSDDNCNNVCKSGDGATGGHCSIWGGKCWCDQ